MSERFGESSIKRGAAEISPMRRAIRDHSSSLRFPARILLRPTRASADNIRIVISERLISSEKITDVLPSVIDACRAISKPSVDLPTAGLAARTIMLPGCNPFVSESKSLNPVFTPSAPTPLEIASISSSACGNNVLSCT
ncbi:unannotated protein [freshwater metagenome]|uniref:Unannotated protein n=1 Tax=freshwater metagenome TaxID=449393 RepID=A0A6J7MJX5_9ZZZZ